MEGNRDSADLCYVKATSALKEGDQEKAIRLLQKSLRLFETNRAKVLLNALNLRETGGQTSSPPRREEPAARQRKKSAEKPAEPTGVLGTDYQQEDVDIVKSILACKNDYYKILGLEKDANENEVKKAYRKKSLKVHPDKNQAPRADEAFKAIGKAYSVLSDPDKKANFERYGADGPQIQQRGHGHQGGFYDDDVINPEEIFNMFFGGGMPQARMHRTRTTHFRFNSGQQRGGQHGQESNNLGAWLQFMPLLVLIGLSLISNLMTPDPVYSLHRYSNRGYATKIFTSTDRIPYYVQSNFAQEYAPESNERRLIEKQVRSEHIENLRVNCYQETLNAEQKMRRAQLYRDKGMMEAAQNMPRPNCNRLNELVGGA